MTTDELLDAHMQRLRTDPGYSAIWQRANSRLYPDMKLIVAMLAWAEQADGLRAMAQHAGQAQSPSDAERNRTAIRLAELLAWCVAQFQGESGAGESYWEQFPEYEAACKIVDMARRAGIIAVGKKA